MNKEPMTSPESLKYPIGKFEKPGSISEENIRDYISQISSFPQRMRELAKGLTQEQLRSSYRPQGWTLGQVVNHCADSHMNAMMRFKLALTEEKPTIKPYLEALWAELPDTKDAEIDAALKTLEGVHKRWTVLLKAMSPQQFQRSFIHPESGQEIRLDHSLALYVWHGKHHLAHIEKGIEQPFFD